MKAFVELCNPGEAFYGPCTINFVSEEVTWTWVNGGSTKDFQLPPGVAVSFHLPDRKHSIKYEKGAPVLLVSGTRPDGTSRTGGSTLW